LVIEMRLCEEGARHILRSVERASAMGVVDKDGNRINNEPRGYAARRGSGFGG
jgi:hypothetical protein